MPPVLPRVFFPLFNSFIMSDNNFVYSCQWQIENVTNEWACKYLNGPHIVIAYILSIYLPEMTRVETLLQCSTYGLYSCQNITDTSYLHE